MGPFLFVLQMIPYQSVLIPRKFSYPKKFLVKGLRLLFWNTLIREIALVVALAKQKSSEIEDHSNNSGKYYFKFYRNNNESTSKFYETV